MKADRDIYESADGQVVEADDPNAAFLVARKGIEIPEKTVKRLGLGEQGTTGAEPASQDAAKDAAPKRKASKGKKK